MYGTQTKFRREVTGDFIEDSMRNFCEIDANGHGKVTEISRAEMGVLRAV